MNNREPGLLKKYSFDLYGRYKIPSTIIDLNRQKDQRFSVLDVGGRGNILKDFLPGDDVWYLDPNVQSGDVNFIEADGCHIPRNDCFFDWVISCDVFEHIEKEKRCPFLAENLRVAKDGMILAAPFFSPKIKNAEEEVSAFHYQLFHQNHPWFIEHIANELPDLEETLGFLKTMGLSYEIIHNNHLALWKIIQKITIAGIQEPDELNFYYNNFIYPKDIMRGTSTNAHDYYRTILYVKKERKVISFAAKIATPEGMLSETEKFETLDRYITDSLKSLTALQKQIASLRQAVGERDQVVETLTEQVAERDAAVDDRDGKIASLNQTLYDKNVHINSLSKILAERDGQIAALYHSTSWRVTRPLRQVGRIWCKLGDVRAVVRRLLRHEPLSALSKRTLRVLRNEGLKCLKACVRQQHYLGTQVGRI